MGTGKHRIALTLAVASCGALLVLLLQRCIDRAARSAAIPPSTSGGVVAASFNETVAQRMSVQSAARVEEPPAPDGRRLSLLVVDPYGRPIERARVESIPEGFSRTTDSMGLLVCEERSFSRPPFARVSAEGRSERSIYLDWKRSQITVVLSPEISLRGILTPPSCNPATVLCWERGSSPPSFQELSRYRGKTTTLADGTFTLSGLSEGRQIGRAHV